MFKFNQKKIILAIAVTAIILFLASLVPALRPSVINLFKFPMFISELAARETRGVIFYHRNYVENNRLKNEVGLLKQRLSELSEASLENARLNNLLSLKKKSPNKVIAAQVIARSSDNWSSVVIINKGRNQGIRAGCVAISYFGLAGRIIETGGSTSRLMLINDPSLSVSAIDQRSRQEGLVSGTLGDSLIMRYLSKDADIAAGDVIVSSGLTSAYPKGLLIGRVEDVAEEFSGLSRYALIKPATNPSNIEEVLIIVQ